MGVTKKPAVIAKTAKRGRPAGSKNKPKDKIALVYAGDERLPKFKGEKPVDWEKLSKQLQEALAHEMKLTEKYESASLFQRIKFLFTGRV